jgi:hypothetical protein
MQRENDYLQRKVSDYENDLMQKKLSVQNNQNIENHPQIKALAQQWQ